MWSVNFYDLLILLCLLLMVPVKGWSSELRFGDGTNGKNNSRSPGWPLPFGHIRMGIRGFGSSTGPVLPEGCNCHKDSVLLEEIECVCRGYGVKDLKANLTKGVTRL
ncbi:hypothetical protein JTE90_014670 [Oedothorax gibbosus]|uniref:Uncharacterized protein n=1 Tax=Oedothorax gibbosus TaxID=931172 RepID=A0AAV6VA99_9ARAC|nr:hypothetical protein JTE90_014670 [Oedothorax gibbosus]